MLWTSIFAIASLFRSTSACLVHPNRMFGCRASLRSREASVSKAMRHEIYRSVALKGATYSWLGLDLLSSYKCAIAPLCSRYGAERSQFKAAWTGTMVQKFLTTRHDPWGLLPSPTPPVSPHRMINGGGDKAQGKLSHWLPNRMVLTVPPVPPVPHDFDHPALAGRRRRWRIIVRR